MAVASDPEVKVEVIHHEASNQSAPQTLIFIAGWPDSEETFEKQFEAFSKDYRIATLLLPGFKKTGPRVPRGKYSISEIVLQLHSSVQEIMKGRPGKPILLGHDWGGAFVHLVARKFPDLMDKFVAIDVAGHFDLIQGTVYANLFVVYYQLACIIAYFLHTYFYLPTSLADRYTRFIAWSVSARPVSIATAHHGMNYIYVQYWKGLIMRNHPSGLLGYVELPENVDVLFLYGADKPYKFHSERWFKHLASKPGSRVVGLKGGHWSYRFESPAEANAEIRAFIQ